MICRSFLFVLSRGFLPVELERLSDFNAIKRNDQVMGEDDLQQKARKQRS